VTPQGIKETELGQTLLNGNNIAMVSLPSGHPFHDADEQLIPGGKGPKA
jgi:hypothetical protein